MSGGQNCIGHKSPALDIRAQLVTTELEMEAGRGDHQGRESGEDTVGLMDQVGREGTAKGHPRVSTSATGSVA